ncbi:MAG: hypothetical protein KTR16_03280 [Acidiferrobacterales bacterium]|nr:hypothetical protein [Acidiferrobacterales bacterium]
MSLKNLSGDEPLPIGKSLRHLIVFQFKLLADAGRDLLLSPLSVIVFITDAVFRPKVSNSLTVRLMKMGRYSDRIINLFNEYSKSGVYTFDDGVSEIEDIVQKKNGTTKRKAAPF